MAKYLLKRILLGILSCIAVVAIVMVMIYGLLDRNLIFATDPVYTKQLNNQKVTYSYGKWEEYGYLDYVPYSDYLQKLEDSGEINESSRTKAALIGRTADKDSKLAAQYIEQFTKEYEAKGYKVKRLDAVMKSTKNVAEGGNPALFAYKDKNLFKRMFNYFTGLFKVDNIHYVKDDLENRGLSFTLFDPVYGGDKFSPAIMGTGTQHKYLLYFDNQFPYMHQNLLTLKLGTSYTVTKGSDVWETMTKAQGEYKKSQITYPTGVVTESADDLHTAVYQSGSRETSELLSTHFTDDYTNTTTVKTSKSKIGFSFVIGILATIISYIIGIPVGIAMARKKDKLVDKIGTAYIVFVIAVPALAYIFLFKAIGGKLGFPTSFDLHEGTWLMYVLPIISLVLPAVGNLMKWLRRYMIDQMNSDYVKFARSGGLTENEIFKKHIFKNAAIPIIHGIPGAVLVALVGGIITERVYVIPGTGNLLTEAINKYDNGVIVGVTLFYALITIVSIILGDILISTVDPRISFSSKDR